MKLKKFLANIEAIVKEHPEVLELEVVTSSDDEGNSFNEIHFNPTIGKYHDREFENIKEGETPNCICVN